MALPAILSNDDIAKFRTSTCERFAATGECLFSSRCQYSHNIEWRRRSPIKYRYEPRLCEHYSHALSYIMMDTDPTNDNNNHIHHHRNHHQPPRRMRCRCPLGRSCRLSHSEEEVLFHPWVYKALLCEDVCCTRYYCPFAHCPEEVRASPLSQQELHECLAPFLYRGAQHRQLQQQQEQQQLSEGLIGGEPSFAADDDSIDDGDDSINSIVDDIATAADTAIRQPSSTTSFGARGGRGTAAAPAAAVLAAAVSPSIASTTNEMSGISSKDLSESEEQEEWDIMGNGKVIVSSSIPNRGTRNIYKAKEKGDIRGSSTSNKNDSNSLKGHHLAKIIPIGDSQEEEERGQQQKDNTTTLSFLHQLQSVFPEQILLSNNKRTSAPSSGSPFDEPVYHNRLSSLRGGSIRQIVRELALLARSPHNNIVNISHICESSSSCITGIVVTISECDMSLNEMLAGFGASIDSTDPSSSALSGDMVQILARDITAGLQRMHFFNIHHGRLSANNVLVDLPSAATAGPSRSRVTFRIGDHIGKVKMLDIINIIKSCSSSIGSIDLDKEHTTTTTAAAAGGGEYGDAKRLRSIANSKAKEILSEDYAKEGWYPPEISHLLQMLVNNNDIHSIDSLTNDIDWSLVDVWGLGAVVLFAITGIRPRQWEDRLPDPTAAASDDAVDQTKTRPITCKQLFGRYLDPLFLDYLSRMLKRRPCYREPLAITACHPLLRDPQSILDSIRRLPIPNRSSASQTTTTTTTPSTDKCRSSMTATRMYNTPFNVEQQQQHSRYTNNRNNDNALDGLSRTPSHFDGDARVFRHICQVPLSSRGDSKGTVLDILSYIRRKVDDMDNDGECDHRLLQETVSLLLKNPSTLILTFDAERISQYLTLSNYINTFHQRYQHLNLSWMMMTMPHPTIKEEEEGYNRTGVVVDVDDGGLLSDIVSYRTFVHDALL